MVDLICIKCDTNYQKPKVFQQYLIDTNNCVFYKWSLQYCDKCRREKELQALKSLPENITKLA